MPFTKLGAEIWRDDVVIGLPSSGRNPPHKPDIRTWATEVEAIFAGLGATGTLVSLSADNTWTGANSFVKNQSALTNVVVSNNSAGSLALATWSANNGTLVANFGVAGAGYTAVPLLQNRAFLNSSGGGGIAILNNDAQPIIFGTNGIQRGSIDGAGQWNILGGPLVIDKSSAGGLPAYANSDIFIKTGASNDADGYVIFDTWGVGAQGHNSDTHILGRIARGTRASPSAVGVSVDLSPQVVSSGDSYLLLGAVPYGTTGYSPTPTTFVVLQPAQLQTDTAQGSRVRIGVTKNNTTTVSGGRYFWTFNNDGQLEINLNEVAPPTFALNSSSKLRVIGADNTAIFQSIEGYGANGVPGFNLSHALGTATSPSLVTNTTVLGAYGFNGYGASGFSAFSGAQMRALATQTWASGAEGTALELWTTANNSTTITARVRVDHDGALITTNASANALAVGRLGLTTPALLVDASTASCVTGLSVTAKAAGARLLLAVGSSGADEGLSIDAKGAGTIRLGATSTGAIEFSRNVVPTSSDGAALGTTALMFSDLFVASGAVINFNNSNLSLTHSSGKLTADGALLSSSATAGIGYATGAGGTVTQATSKSTDVTLNKICGEITMNGAALAANTSVSFNLFSTAIAATDVISINHVLVGTGGAYFASGGCAAGAATISVRNLTAGSLSEAIVLRFVVFKGVTS